MTSKIEGHAWRRVGENSMNHWIGWWKHGREHPLSALWAVRIEHGEMRKDGRSFWEEFLESANKLLPFSKIPPPPTYQEWFFLISKPPQSYHCWGNSLVTKQSLWVWFFIVLGKNTYREMTKIVQTFRELKPLSFGSGEIYNEF